VPYVPDRVEEDLSLLRLLSYEKGTTKEDKSMAYSVMVWLVDPGEQAHQEQAMQRTTTGRAQAPGAASGVNEPPAFTRMVYGVYEDQEEADQALGDISVTLQQNAPLRITSGAEHANRTFLIPAHRVHYVVCEYVERPMDRH
jgi:hypothetical protein